MIRLCFVGALLAAQVAVNTAGNAASNVKGAVFCDSGSLTDRQRANPTFLRERALVCEQMAQMRVISDAVRRFDEGVGQADKAPGR